VIRLPLTVMCQTLGWPGARPTTSPGPVPTVGITAGPIQQSWSRFAVTNSRATYGYRRVWAMVNRTFPTGYNRKRIRA
jgi:hypothetical protein